jgi:hypothetical protein
MDVAPAIASAVCLATSAPGPADRLGGVREGGD